MVGGGGGMGEACQERYAMQAAYLLEAGGRT